MADEPFDATHGDKGKKEKDEKKIEEKVLKAVEEGVDLVFSFGKMIVVGGLKEIFEIDSSDGKKDEAAVKEKVKEIKRKAKNRMRAMIDGLWTDVDEEKPKDKVDP